MKLINAFVSMVNARPLYSADAPSLIERTSKGTDRSPVREGARHGMMKSMGNSRCWLINTIESLNGQPHGGQGDFWMWFSQTAFGGTNYECMPVGAVTHTDEPFGARNDPATYLGLWARGKNLGICSWNCRSGDKFQAVGNPLVRR